MAKALFKSLGVFVLLLLLPHVAAEQAQVYLELSSYKVVMQTDDEGRRVEILKPALNVAPGDVIEWRLRAVNKSGRELENVALVIPIPPQTYYLDGSASPLLLERDDSKLTIRPQFSFDGGKTYGFPPLFKEVKEVINGEEVVKKVPVAPEEYTHVRWVLENMLPEESVEVFLRTVVR